MDFVRSSWRRITRGSPLSGEAPRCAIRPIVLETYRGINAIGKILGISHMPTWRLLSRSESSCEVS